MGQAYLLILIGILFTRLNFYVASIGMDLLPDIIGYLLTLYALFRIQRIHKSSFYTYAEVIAILFVINEAVKSFIYPSFVKNVITALILSVLLMAAQIVLYFCILHAESQISCNAEVFQYKKYYLLISIISILVYLYLCFFGGYLVIMNLSAVVETCYLLYVFFHLYRNHRLF